MDVPDSIPPSNNPALLSLAPGVTAPADALRIRFARSGGPGGQNVNKVATKAELWLQLDRVLGLSPSARQRLIGLAGRRYTVAGEIHLSGEQFRTQEANRSDVMQRLTAMVEQALVQPRPRRKTRPSAASRRKRLESKKHRAGIKSQRRREE